MCTLRALHYMCVDSGCALGIVLPFVAGCELLPEIRAPQIPLLEPREVLESLHEEQHIIWACS